MSTEKPGVSTSSFRSKTRGLSRYRAFHTLAGVFNRPRWDVSFHVNMDAASLIGTDTFRAGEVSFRPGPVYTAAKTGGFAVLDEINMAKSEAMAVLHATLDFRRTINLEQWR
jgi:nitric oxide reductase NorQ protein